jgi:THAP domain
MVRRCSIIGCRGNYRQRKGSDDDVKVSVFRFPKDEARLKQWLQKIPQDLKADQITEYMGV